MALYFEHENKILYHIPKTGGFAYRKYYKSLWGPPYKEINPWHGTPNQLEAPNNLNTIPGLMIVRHPVLWLRSFHTYYAQHSYTWPDLPDQIKQWMEPYCRLDWPTFVYEISKWEPNLVGRIYGLYYTGDMEVRRIEDMGLSIHHPTTGLPPVTSRLYIMMARSESETMLRYGYNNYPVPSGERRE